MSAARVPAVVVNGRGPHAASRLNVAQATLSNTQPCQSSMRFGLIYAILSLGAAGCGQRRSNGDAVARGREAIAQRGCGACHTVDGVPGATGLAAPTLNGVASRDIIAGRLSNTRENLARWILNPSAIEPNVAMPPLVNPGTSTVADIVAYLQTLK